MIESRGGVVAVVGREPWDVIPASASQTVRCLQSTRKAPYKTCYTHTCVCVSLCVHACVHTGSQHQGSSPATLPCVGEGVYAHMYCTCESAGRGEVRGTYRCPPQQSSILFLEAGSLSEPDTYISARLRTCLSPKLGFQAPGPVFVVYGGTRDLNSGPLTCPLLLLPTELPSPPHPPHTHRHTLVI